MRSKKTRFTVEFKQEAVKLVTVQGYTQTEAADRLGVNRKNISRWVGELSGKAIPLKRTALSAEQEELQHLRKENKRLKQEREILKKAAAFFANEPV
jgi:transposase